MLGIHFENPKKIDVSDPVSDEFYNYFRQTARKNAIIYEEVFATLPSDHVRKFDQLSSYTEAPKLKETDPILVRICRSIETKNEIHRLFRHKKN